MAFHKETNGQVNREAAERLQRKLFEAAERALDLALADEKVPANLISSVQSVLRDAGLTPDLQSREEAEAQAAGNAAAASWIDDLSKEVGL